MKVSDRNIYLKYETIFLCFDWMYFASMIIYEYN